METKEELLMGVRNWVSIDNEIAQHKAEIKKLNEQKKLLTQSLVDTMKKNDIDCFDIKGGSIAYKRNVTKKAISAKSLLQALGEYYKDDGKTAEELTQYILDNREVQVKETIARKIDKSK
jgi:hypothetical protein